MKKGLMMVVASLVLVLSACSKDNREKLYVYNVGEYIDPEVLKIFEDEFDCKVVYELYDSNRIIQQNLCIQIPYYLQGFDLDSFVKVPVS